MGGDTMGSVRNGPPKKTLRQKFIRSFVYVPVKAYVKFLMWVFLISQCNGLTLRITGDSLIDHATSVAANFPIDPPISVEFFGTNEELAKVGRMDMVVVNAFATGVNTGIKYTMSIDSKFNLTSSGKAAFSGSIAQIPNGEQVLFYFNTIINDTKYETGTTKAVTVTNDIRLAYFRPQSELKNLNDQMEDFMQESVMGMNSGEYGSIPNRAPLPNRYISMDTYKYDSKDLSSAMKQYLTMNQKGKTTPHKKVYGIIGMGSNVASQVILPQSTNDKVSITSFRKDISKDYSDKTAYPYFNRIHLSVDRYLDNVFLYLKNRKWTTLAIVYTSTDDFFGISWDTYAEKYGITLSKYEIPSGDSADYTSVFDSITGSGTRIIMTTATGNTVKNLMKQADMKDITSKGGFQWIGLKNEQDLQFLSTHSEDWCIKKLDGNDYKLCGVTFKGMIILDNIYDNMYNNTEGELLWKRFLTGDNHKALAPRSMVLPSEFSSRGLHMYLAYDAVKVNILAMQRLIYKRMTINGETLSKEIRAETITGLTGEVSLNSNGERTTFVGSISILWPIVSYLQGYMDISKREDWLERDDSNWLRSIIFKRKENTNKIVEEHVMSGYTSTLWRATGNSDDFQGIFKSHIPIEYWDNTAEKKRSMNAMQYSKCIGDYNLELNALTVRPLLSDKIVEQFWPKPLYQCTEQEHNIMITAPYYCAQGCGGKSDMNDVNVYENGQCVRHGKCKCKPGWIGDDCSIAVCYQGQGCNYGRCVAPDQCTCNPGYTGEKCDRPVCSKCGELVKCEADTCAKFNSGLSIGFDFKVQSNVNRSCTQLSPTQCRIGGTCIRPETCSCDADFYHATNRKCGRKCTCNMANAEGCNALTGHCSTCKSGYFSPTSDCKSSYIVIGLSVFFGGLFLTIIGVIAARFFLRRLKLRAALNNNDWIVDWNDVKIADKTTSNKSSMMISAISMNTNMRTEMKQFNLATWDGIDVYYQKFDNDSINLTDAVRIEVKELRELKHMNLSTLIGCCVEAPNVAILTELQPKGSLEDIFNNEDIKLPWNFKFALLKGVCQGLEQIHKSEIKSHGRLKSSNVLVDNRWTVKLTGFGLNQFRLSNKNHDDPNYSQLFWTAPEILKEKDPKCLDDVGRGTQASDIYAFGILLSEFCTRDTPHSEVMLEKEDLIQLIAGKQNDEALEIWDEFLAENNIESGGPVRPVIKDNEWPKKYEIRKMYKKLMESCWDENASKRPPSVKQCLDALNQMDPQKGELIEHLIGLLEMYSNNLEKVIAKRTRQLQIESQRTEDLVSRLLPRAVSEKLKQGLNVEPENFEAVTVYFSDIVGFTTIAKGSTPFEVVALLNNMYTAFDSISAKYDVYKVETIGDAYMIVSGLPTRNGDEHAAHICTVALHLMSIIGGMKIAHMNDKQMQLRAGIHTGNVVAGVVGLKMPRYCLFGDSVNTASAMESGGKPCRIQISGETEKILQRLGGYDTEYRHSVEVDSYGTLSTYWLKGHETFTETLPPWEED